MEELSDNISESSVDTQESTYVSFIESLSEDEYIDLTTTCYEIIDDYVEQNVLHMCEPNYYDIINNEIMCYLVEFWEDANIYHDENDDDLSEFIYKNIQDYFEIMKCDYPLRSKETFSNISNDTKELQKKINILRSIPQPEQRTQEWYVFRHELMTASNLWKLFGTESQYNSLIYEKCCPLKDFSNVGDSSNSVNILSPMHWGQKYEPLSIMLYENKYNTKIEDFGCIQHENYSFIGASPDGINVDPKNDRYGRMLEIKNIVNREINGIPSKAYWIQMQLQMETCDLDECDFLETRFKEYENEEQFYEDHTHNKGVILHFVERLSIGCTMGDTTDTTGGYMLAQQQSSGPKYIYMPLDIELTKESIEKWIEEQRLKIRRSWSLYSVDYWRLDQYSCVFVERNRKWFQYAAPIIEKAWNTILEERVSGYEHRAAKKRIQKPPSLEVVQGNEDSKIIKNLNIGPGICLVKLDSEELNS